MNDMVCTCKDDMDCPALGTVHECLPWCDYLKEAEDGSKRKADCHGATFYIKD